MEENQRQLSSLDTVDLVIRTMQRLDERVQQLNSQN